MPPPYLMGAPFGGGFTDPEVSLSGLSWRLPKIADNGSGGWTCPATDMASTTMGGAPGTLWDVTLRFYGVVESRKYVGGTSDGNAFYTGGSPDPDTGGGQNLWNVYRLTIGSNVYYLNWNVLFVIRALDYNKTFTIAAGTNIELFADSSDGNEGAHTTSLSDPNSPSPQPWPGQWLNMEVVSIVPH